MLGLTLLVASFLGLQQPAPAAQATAVLSGKVTDRQGGALPAATVTLEAPAPGAPRSTEVNSAGEYRFDNIAPGTYAVKFELKDFFLPYTRAGLALSGGQSKTLNVVLELGPNAATEHPTVPPPVSPDPKFDLAPGEIAVGIETSLGSFYIAVDPKRAPITATNFLRYVDAKLYD